MSVDTRVCLLPVLEQGWSLFARSFLDAYFEWWKDGKYIICLSKICSHYIWSFFVPRFSIYEMKKNKVKKLCLYKAPMGLEPMTFCLLDRRSNQLNYGASRFTVCARFRHHWSRSETLRTVELPLKIDTGISYSNISESPRNILLSLFSSCLESCE